MTSPFNIPASCETSTWDTDRWDSNDDKWPKGFTKPRTCSFCGSVHPDDVISLLEQGWELEMSTKSYKSYWHPPGYRARIAEAISDIVSFVEGEHKPPKYVDPIPPVKLYGNHVTAEQVTKINAILAVRHAQKG